MLLSSSLPRGAVLTRGAPRYRNKRIHSVVRASGSSEPKTSSLTSVGDVMTTGTLHAVQPDDTVDQALEILVAHRITGLPVVDGTNKVVGVVSDFDLLALDLMADTNLFPSMDETWQAFKEVKRMLAKSAGKKIKDVMTPRPFTVSPETDLEEATRILLMRKIRRLPVVDAEGKLVGLISRGNIVRAALQARKQKLTSINNGSQAANNGAQ